jgi:hypothetical protein
MHSRGTRSSSRTVAIVPSASETLAAFAAELRFEMLPAGVVAKVKLHLLDVLGVALAGAHMQFGTAVVRAAAAMGGAPTCTAIGFRERLPAVWAALVNGTLAHGRPAAVAFSADGRPASAWLSLSGACYWCLW